MSESQEAEAVQAAEKQLVETENAQTPSEVVAPEQVKEPEKPAEPDSGEQKPEQAAVVPPEKTPEQLDADRAFFQRKAQEEQAAKKEALDQLEALQSAPVAEEKPAVVPQVTPQVAQQSPESMTDEQLNELLQDNPMLQTQLIQAGVTKDVLAAIDKRDETRTLNSESLQTNKVLMQFADKHNIPRENVTAELESLKSQGILGRPAAMGRLVIDRLNLAKSQEIGQQQVEKAKADASQAVKNQLLTVQPEGGGKIPTSEAITREEAIANRFGASPAKSREQKLLDEGGF